MTGSRIVGRAVRSLAGMVALGATGLVACSDGITSTGDHQVIAGSSAALALSTPSGVIEQTKDRQPPKVCAALGYPYSAGPYTASGTYAFGDGRITVTLNADGSVGWSMDFEGAALVLVHGGNRYNSYAGSSAGTGIAAVNASGKPAGFSNLVVCMGKPPALRPSAMTSTSFTRQHNWTIAKTAGQSDVTIEQGATAPLPFTVALSSTATDRDHAIAGTLTITNTSWLTANVTSVSVQVAGIGDVATTCTGTFTIAGAFGTRTCAFTTPAPDAATRAVTASVTTSGPVAGGTTTTDAVFGEPTTVIDPSVTVTDREATWTASVGGANTFPYAMVAGPYSTCGGTESVVNTASFTAPGGATGSATATTNVRVTCPPPPPPAPPVTPPTPGYVDGGTAFAQGGTCFLDIPGLGGSRWGWSIPLAPGVYTFDLMMGAAHCQGGTNVGTVTIEYRGTSATVTFNTTGRYRVDQAHAYARGTQITNTAPGNYGNVSGAITPTTGYTFTIENMTGGLMYFVPHAHIVILQ